MPKIGVLEWEVGQLGGRHRTMIAFATALHEHSRMDVRLISQPPCSGSWAFEELVPPAICKWAPRLKRQMTQEQVPDELRGLDALLVPYGGFGYLQDLLPKTVVIQWVIHPEQARHPAVKHTWTNSLTTVERLRASERWADSAPRVVTPPHDLSPFTQQLDGTRPLDVLCVGSLLKSKRLIEFAETALSCGWNAMIIGSCWPAIAEEAGEVLTRTVCTGIPTRVNLPRRVVAHAMGSARVLAAMSLEESAPLITWEGMAAGAVPVMRGAGAIREQVGECGYVADSDGQFRELVPRALGQAGRLRAAMRDRALSLRDYATAARTVVRAIEEVL